MVTLFLMFVASVVGILIALRAIDGLSEIPEAIDILKGKEQIDDERLIAFVHCCKNNGKPKKAKFCSRRGRFFTAKIIFYSNTQLGLSRNNGPIFWRKHIKQLE